ncbi:2-dehydro-3-deoxygalactonokinase [Sphingomonas rubra]|uniref:2-dehydro-3-deoxygalactonokinase n=1 Tax=Sphingomonas rubra TaxID=634430 RepID=A0A1I5RF55_9SPHN|nr:2-dehydro-3-deoxygalactonokinase [Sphingomonas rubra]SFP57010.1 2-dehydro-3-deoxygalactonokinase [Sphingomonas rubra]
MPSAATYIAVDWGTTNRRAALIGDDGVVLDGFSDDRGVLSLSRNDYPGEFAAIRGRLGNRPIVAAGMIGSNRGWRDVPYVDVPADLDTLARGAWRDEAHAVTILPGVAQRHPRADVMRGEEVQVVGAVAVGVARAEADGAALFCQPGTHNKWIDVAGDRITGFATTMTGELFALLRRHGTLAGMLDAPVTDGPAFREGLARARSEAGLATALFGVRAGVLLGTVAPADAASFASGLLIGADVAGRAPGGRVHLLGNGPLVDLYAAAIGENGAEVVPLDGTHAFAAGLRLLWEKTR